MKKVIKDVILMLVFMIFAGFYSVYMGMERCWDTRNYHIYSPWAFLNDRLNIDIMPAGIQSYFNPLTDTTYFICIKLFNNHPLIVTFMWGFGYALFLFMTYKIAKLVFKKYNTILLVVCSIIIASGSGIILRFVGSIAPDIFIGDLALLAIYFLIKSFGDKIHKKSLFAAGLSIGAAFGLKLTAVIFAVPLVITFILFYKQYAKPMKSFLIFISGAALSFLILDGFWIYKLYITFSNPVFPYFNYLFHSPLISSDDVFNIDFGAWQPKSIKEILCYPMRYKYDLRFKLLCILFIVNLFTIPFINKEKFRQCFDINIRYTDFMLIFSCLSFFVWIKTFGTPRYYAPIFCFTGIAAFVVSAKIYYIFRCIVQYIYKNKSYMNKIFDNSKVKQFYICIISFVLLILFLPKFAKGTPNKLMRVPIGKQILYVENLNIPDNAVVIVQQGTGIFVPFQNPKARYIHLNAIQFTKKGISLLSDAKQNEIKRLIKNSPDKIYFLTDAGNLGKYNSTKSISDVEKAIQKSLENHKEHEKIKNMINQRINLEKRGQKIPRGIPSLNYLNKKLIKVQRTKMPKVSAIEIIVYELYKIGVDYKSMKCHLIQSNIKDPDIKYKNPEFYFCKAEIK